MTRGKLEAKLQAWTCADQAAGPDAPDTGQRFPDTGRGQIKPRDIDRDLQNWGHVPGQTDVLDALRDVV